MSGLRGRTTQNPCYLPERRGVVTWPAGCQTSFYPEFPARHLVAIKGFVNEIGDSESWRPGELGAGKRAVGNQKIDRAPQTR